MKLFGDNPRAELQARLSARPRMVLKAKAQNLAESAVLLPLFVVQDEPPELLYIVRHANLRTHSGQIAFPGGKREPSDPSLEYTALRESSEEIGLPVERVELCGMLDDIPTIGVFAITPVVGLLRERPPLLNSVTEVADTFVAPIAALVASYHRADDAFYAGVRYAMPEFRFPDPRATSTDGIRRIWGATARITYQFLELLDLLPPLPTV